MTDVIIVGAGVAGALVAKSLGEAGLTVLVLEAGEGLAQTNAAYLERFFTAQAKVPESAYPPDLVEAKTGAPIDPGSQNAARPTVLSLGAQSWRDPRESYLVQNGPLPFGSTYERLAGGSGRHWLGTSLRLLPSDLRMASTFGRFTDWPLSLGELEPWYTKAESELGVCGEGAYPMPAIPASLADAHVARAVGGLSFDGFPLHVTPTPAARNSRAYQGRPPCQGNASCIPICPIGAKYDPTVALRAAMQTGNVELRSKCVATQIVLAEDGSVEAVEYVRYEHQSGGPTATERARARVFVIAAHGIETPRLLLLSKNAGRTPAGVANGSDQVGRNLMDHPIYLAWALAKQPVFGYRGPLSTSGIESLRDGAFRSSRGAFRIEIGNDGWSFPIGDPETTTLDFVLGLNASGLNPSRARLCGTALAAALNDALTRQIRLAFLVEQSPDAANRVTLSTVRDGLGLARPQIAYDLSDYTRAGFLAAKRAASAIFSAMGAKEFTAAPAAGDPSAFTAGASGRGERLRFFGAGHVIGTYRMGSDPKRCVVDANQRSWEHHNLFLVGSGTFPTSTTANPTLTLAALALRTARAIATEALPTGNAPATR
ncbi:MAG TPA: GMC family oxidoreductase [Verrucomicrobiae bacterium]|nr:GMC family oxidoreductase [Verrucomicrobiae bacterium]